PIWIVDQEDGTDAGIVPGTDVLTVAFGNRASGTNIDSTLNASIAANANPIVVTTTPGNTAMFAPSEFVLLIGTPGMAGVDSDIGCTLLQITSIAAIGSTLNFASDASATCAPGTNPCTGSRWNPSGAAPAGMIPATGYVASPTTGVRNFGELWWVRFSIRNAAPNNPLSIPVLAMERLDGSVPTGPQVLAEGIEDLQVAFACDVNSDGVLTENFASRAQNEWNLDDPNNPNDPLSLTNASKCNQPSAIRITLVARSLTEDNGIDAALTQNRRPQVENHPAGAVDQFRRRVMTTTMYPRNN
ncbi:MAG TPA: PilW family protein, partial [Polyangia bacterium]